MGKMFVQVKYDSNKVLKRVDDIIDKAQDLRKAVSELEYICKDIMLETVESPFVEEEARED